MMSVITPIILEILMVNRNCQIDIGVLFVKSFFYIPQGLGVIESYKNKFCSKDCKNKHNQEWIKKQDWSIEMECQNCGIPWHANRKYGDSKRIFCSSDCRIEYDSKQICSDCGSIGNVYKDGFCYDCYFKSFTTKCNNCNKKFEKES